MAYPRPVWCLVVVVCALSRIIRSALTVIYKRDSGKVRLRREFLLNAVVTCSVLFCVAVMKREGDHTDMGSPLKRSRSGDDVEVRFLIPSKVSSFFRRRLCFPLRAPEKEKSSRSMMPDQCFGSFRKFTWRKCVVEISHLHICGVFLNRFADLIPVFLF